MMEMRVEATVDGGQPMTVNVNGQHMSVMVPPHVRQGEPFTFQIQAPEPQIAMAQPVSGQYMTEQSSMTQPMLAQAQPVLTQPVMAQPVMAQPVMAQPVMAQPVMVQPAMVQPAMAPQQMGVPPGAIIIHEIHTGRGPPPPDYVPPGAPPGGYWSSDNYCGDMTLITAFLLAFFCTPLVCCCVPCCPCDTRPVYRAPDGERYLVNGAIAPNGPC
jgi:hypothetical protein